jgi:hypothetical protein
MSRRVRMNLRRWVCKHFGHRTDGSTHPIQFCDRCFELFEYRP